MKPNELRPETADKIKKVQELCAELKMSVFPKIIANENGINPVIQFTDNETYPMPALPKKANRKAKKN